MVEIQLSRRSALIGGLLFAAGSQVSQAEEPATPPKAEAKPEPLSISEQLQHATVQIRGVTAQGEQSSGTGFIFGFFQNNGESVLALVTNKHVVIEQENVFLRWTLQTPQGKPDYGNFIDVKFENFSQAWLPHPDPEIDLAIIPVVEMLRSLAGQGKKVFFVSLDQSIIPTENQLKELQPLEDVIIVGYPDGISDSKNNIPIFRRGITATPAYMQFEGRKQFLIDAAIYPGSSGSPVLLYNSGSWGNRSGGLQIGTRVNLLGVVFAVANHAATGEIKIIPAPTQYRQIVVSNVPNNLGVCLQSHLILDFEPEIVKRGYKPPDGYVMRSKL